MRKLLILFFVTALTAACEKPTPVPKSNEQTIFMYFPFSGNSGALTPYFKKNIADMESVVARGALKNSKVLVYFMPNAASAELFELYYDNGNCLRRSHKTYEVETLPAFTTAGGITSILNDVKTAASANRYGLVIGSHGMSWIPATPPAPARQQLRPGGPAVEREKEYWDYAEEGMPLTRWFGGNDYQTDISTLAQGISGAGMKMEFILFDACYISSVEVAYDLRNVTNYLIGSTSEIMGDGFPYALMGQYLIGKVDYEGVCDGFYNFYRSYSSPYGTVAVTVSSELDALADVMKRINAKYTFDIGKLGTIQRLDGYNPVRFFDMGDYVAKLISEQGDPLLSEFNARLEKAVPAAYHRHTPQYYSMSSGPVPINTFSGITISDPTISTAATAKTETAWWKATHN